MRSLLSLGILATLIVAATMTSTADAQVGPKLPPRYGTGFRPNLSPYLNLLRGGDLSANYFLGVIPEQQRRADTAVLRSRTRDLDARTRQLEGEVEEIDVGAASDFGDTRGFFQAPGTYYQKTSPFPTQPASGRPRGR